MDDQTKLKKWISTGAYVIIIVSLIAIIALLILKYEVEGEKNMPFQLTSMVVVSNAAGFQETENADYRWDAEIYQNNDIYLNIEKNKNMKQDEAIKKITIDHIQITKQPKIGTIEFYRPSQEKNVDPYQYTEQYQIQTAIEYEGDMQSDLQHLKISNQGGTLVFRVLNKTGKKFTSNEEMMEHNGTLLKKVGISKEEIQAKISFDLTIVLESEIAFQTTIELELPVGDMIQEGSSSIEINDKKQFIFKREIK